MRIIAPPRSEADVRKPVLQEASAAEVKASMAAKAEDCVDHLCGCNCGC